MTINIGTAGWGIATRYRDQIPPGGTHLARYARVFPIVEVDTSFYKHHRRTTYERWAGSCSIEFRFSVKIPKSLTHEGNLEIADTTVLDQFADEVGGLGDKLTVVLVQLPPSLQFDAPATLKFFSRVRAHLARDIHIACEPRHASWSSCEANECFTSLGVARVAADRSRWEGNERPGGDLALAYFRLHGSPRVYYSDYPEGRLREFAAALRQAEQHSESVWCILDNTAHGHAIANALNLLTITHG